MGAWVFIRKKVVLDQEFFKSFAEDINGGGWTAARF
jgi:hypothetical protein